MKVYNILPILILFTVLCTIQNMQNVSADLQIYYTCYQETANISTSCGGLNTGIYSTGSQSFYINYSKPLGVNNATWTVGYEDTALGVSPMRINLTIPYSCFNAYVDKLPLLITSTTDADLNHSLTAYCINQTGNISLFNVSAKASWGAVISDSVFYDENWSSGAVWGSGAWKIPGPGGPASQGGGTIYEEGINWHYPIYNYSSSYNNVTYESSLNIFTLNVSAVNILSIDANFYYNGTKYSTVKSGSLSNQSFTTNLEIPLLLNSNPANRSLFWELSLFDGTNVVYINTSVYNQTVNPISISRCTSAYPSLNFTNYDEQLYSRNNPFNFDATFKYYLGSGSIYRILNITNSTSNEIYICLGQNITYYLDSIIAYYPNSSYPIRNYNTQRFPINNITQNINLLSLKSSSSTSFILKALDENAFPVKDLIIAPQKCYSGINQNITAFAHKTDADGYTIGNLEAEQALYQWYLLVNNSVVLAVTPCAKVVPQSPPYTLTFNLGGSYISPFLNIDNLTSVDSSLKYYKANGTIIFTYASTSNEFSHANLVILEANNTGSNQITVCSGQNNLSTGIIICNVSEEKRYIAQAYITYGNVVDFVNQISFTVSDLDFGQEGMFLGVIIILVSSFLFGFKVVPNLWMNWLAIFLVNLLGLIHFGYTYVFAHMGILIILTAVLER